MSEDLTLFGPAPQRERLGIGNDNCSHYFRACRLLLARCTLEVPGVGRVRFIRGEEAEAVAEAARKRNVFVRNSYDNSFYLQQIRRLSNRTVIEVTREGEPDAIRGGAEKAAEVLQRIAVLSSALGVPREKLHRLLGVAPSEAREVDVTIGPRFYCLRSRSRRQPASLGIPVDRRFCKRFERCGFGQLAALCLSRASLGPRVEKALGWLFESRQEPRVPAAVVKTAIALESFLSSGGSEPAARSLSERAAFLLASQPAKRAGVCRAVRRFYDVRSRIVHGESKGAGPRVGSLLEGVDRLTLLLCLVLAANEDKWESEASFREWCEGERWGSPTTLRTPFPMSYLTNALKLTLANNP